MKTPSTDQLEKLPFGPVQETTENKLESSLPVTSPVKRTPSQDGLLIPEKGNILLVVIQFNTVIWVVEEKVEEQQEDVDEQPT